MIYKEAMVSYFFGEWFKLFLLPELTKKSIIIMDNATFHRINFLQEMQRNMVM